MSLRSSIQRLRETPPRVATLIRAQNDEGSLGPRQMTARQIANRARPLLPYVAQGAVPLDDPTITAGIGRAIEKLWQEQEGHNA